MRIILIGFYAESLVDAHGAFSFTGWKDHFSLPAETQYGSNKHRIKSGYENNFTTITGNTRLYEY